jgi:uncharacterized membrane protein YeaQ/YmgE (transglycosylase-associated protein family)
MHLIWTILIGALIGAVAKLMLPGKDPGGFFITAIIGIIGSIIATYLGRFMGLYAEGETAGFIMSVIGAIILLVAYRYMTKQTA